MKVKGTGLKTTRDFVKTNFPSKYAEWINSLSPEARRIYSTDIIDVGKWYDIKPAYYEPIDMIVRLIYRFDSKKAGDELGRYSAEVALKGIYKVFLLVASPQYLMKRAANMMKAFYDPSEIEVSESSKKQVVVKIKKFDGINRSTEYRIAGWCAKALELCNCSNVRYKFLNQLSSGNENTSIQFDWD